GGRGPCPCRQGWGLLQFEPCPNSGWDIHILDGTALGPGHRGRAYQAASHGQTDPGNPSKTKCGPTDANCGGGRSGTELCRPPLPGNHRHPKGPYEDEPAQHHQPTGGHRGRKTRPFGAFQKTQGDPFRGTGSLGNDSIKVMKKRFYSNGKLLLSGEYAILDGALGLAIPTSYGQSLRVAPTT